MLQGNKHVIRNLNHELLGKLENPSNINNVIRVVAKNESPTLIVTQNGEEKFLHSSYNPEREARTIAESINVGEGTPLVFVGVGLGYHLPLILEKVKPRFFFIVEILPSILTETLNTIDLNQFIYKNLSSLFLASTESEMKDTIINILQKSPTPPQLVILPSYQRIFQNEIEFIYRVYQEKITHVYDQLASDYSFQALWGINSLNNLPIILDTPNLFRDVDQKQFKGKPAIIVGAGPSLTYEIDNLKKIQEEQSAYIFAVGSAINALIEYDIRPHAVIAYDPKKESTRVFEKINQVNIRDIPLIFGSTIGSDALTIYPGEKIHFILNQDFLMPYVLFEGDFDYLKIINDGPTVTVIALQLLGELECDPIILVGQNLSFDKNRRYAKGIQYKKGSSAESVVPTKTFYVQSVNGENLTSSKEFILAKNGIEEFLSNHSYLNVINCTKGGAAIQYSTYAPLESILKDFIKGGIHKEIKWNKQNNYDRGEVIRKMSELSLQSEKFPKKLELVIEILKEIESYKQKKNAFMINNFFSKLDACIHGVRELDYYKIFIEPMTRSYYDLAVKEIQFIKNNKNINEKASDIVNTFNKLIISWLQVHKELSVLLDKIRTVISN